MGNKRKYQKAKIITLAKQLVSLRTTYPDGVCTIEKRKRLRWSGKMRPSPLSEEYTVLLIYELGRSPHVWVIGDELQKLDDPNFPHYFEIDIEHKKVRLCLYRYQEFDKYLYLSKTIIPWTVEWLYFYETWLASGKWCGGGEHPQMVIRD